MKIEEKMFVNLDLFEHLFHRTLKGEGGFWSRISENKKKTNHDSRKLKFAIFENFINHDESIQNVFIAKYHLTGSMKL
jgi:hypothetical protein